LYVSFANCHTFKRFVNRLYTVT